MSKSDNPFEIFLDIKTDPKKPDFAKILGVNLKTASEEEIKLACDKAIAKVRSQKPGDKTKEWSWLIDHLKKAKDALVARAQKRVEASTVQTKQPKSSTPADKVGSYSPPVSAEKSSSDLSKSPQVPPKSRPVASTKRKAKSPKEKESEPKSSGTNVALPPVFDKKKKTSTAKSSRTPAAAKVEANNGDKSKKDESGSAGKPSPFNLDAPDQNDSFDSDTQFSASSFGVSPANSVTANTIDPMAPVDDPTENWDAFDVSQIDKYGMIASATAVASPAATKTVGAAPQAGSSPEPIRDKTFYGESYRKKSKVGVMIGGTLLAMLIVTGITYGVLFGFNNSGNKEVAQGENKDNGEAPKKNDASNNQNSQSQTDVKDEDEQPPAKKQNSDDPSKKQDDSEMPETGGPDTEMKNEKTEPEKTDTVDTTPAKTDNEPPKKSPDDPEMKKKEPEPPTPKNSDIAELARLMTEIREKLNERNFVDSGRLLTKAQALPILPDHKLKLDRLVQINELYEKFWNAVVEGCSKLKALDEIKFSDTNIVKIVESSDERVVYRALGQRFDKAPRELQIGLAMKIAEKEIDMLSAEGKLIKGAVFAIEAAKNPDRADEARSTWEEAKLVGAETDELILFLDDTYDELLTSVIKKEKVPTEDEITQAQERFREKYADNLKQAGRNQKAAIEFANQLLKDVPTLDNSADRHANLVAATFYAGKNSDLELVMKSLSDMNKWFTIDLEAETLDALTKVNKNRLKPDQKREIARTAFEYMDRAKAASNSELELKFAELALAAARGTRDPKLVQTATREVQRVKAFMASDNSNQ